VREGACVVWTLTILGVSEQVWADQSLCTAQVHKRLCASMKSKVQKYGPPTNLRLQDPGPLCVECLF
jgi:hypothetical protein